MMGFLLALQFLTCFPIPYRPKLHPSAYGQSMRWFPVVGALLGISLGLLDTALAPLVAPDLRSIILVGLLVIMTGALHIDGLMDTCDALLAPVPAERRLEILWDSRVGSYAVVGAALALLMKYAAFASIPDAIRLPTLVATLSLSRWSMVYATVRYPAARPMGLGATYKAGVSTRDLLIATLFAILAAMTVGGAGLTAFVLAWATTIALARAIMTKIPGLTGDTYGAIAETVEIAVAIWLPIFARVLPPQLPGG